MRNKIIIGVLVIIACLGIYVFTSFSNENEIIEEEVDDFVKDEVSINEVKKVTIDIKGAINNPGVYEVDNTSRVNDVILIAGGLKKDANTNYINLSARVTDEMVIWIYTNKEIEKLKLEQSSTKYMIESCNCPTVDNTACLNSDNNNKESNGIVNLNTASLEDLMTLDGVGESKAKAIIEYRTINGKFKSIEDVMNVSGIGEALYAKIKAYITV